MIYHMHIDFLIYILKYYAHSVSYNIYWVLSGLLNDKGIGLNLEDSTHIEHRYTIFRPVRS